MVNVPDCVICTIVAKNYISFARTLAQSFLEHHPDGRCFVLFIDEIDSKFDASEECFSVVELGELDIPRIKNLAMKYNITEFSTSVKPFFLNYLLRQYELESLLYLDPDILVTDSLLPLVSCLDDADIILTPHLDKDYPDDGLLPNDAHIMRSGIFNLGFIGLRNCENSLSFLNWWETKLYDRCVIDHCQGYMVDQKFIDYAFVLFENIRVIHDTSYNVAYWNLHSRKIEYKNNRWLCNDRPLNFFHFSDFKPDKPMQISGHQNRHTISEYAALRKLFGQYRDLLLNNGFTETRQWEYSWARYKNGKLIDNQDRLVFRDNPAMHVMRDPFDYSQYPLRFKFALFKRRTLRRFLMAIRIPLLKIIEQEEFERI